MNLENETMIKKRSPKDLEGQKMKTLKKNYDLNILDLKPG